MSYQYSLVMENYTVAASAATLILARPSAAVGFKVLRGWARQRQSATSGQVGIQLGRKAAALPTLAAGITPTKLDDKDPVSALVSGTAGAAGTVGIYATAEGAGVFTPIINEDFNNLTGWEWTPVYEDIVFRAGGDACVLRFPASPVQTVWDIGLIIGEI